MSLEMGLVIFALCFMAFTAWFIHRVHSRLPRRLPDGVHKECLDCRYYTKNPEHDIYRCHIAPHCPVAAEELEGGIPVDEYSRQCRERERKFHDALPRLKEMLPGKACIVKWPGHGNAKISIGDVDINGPVSYPPGVSFSYLVRGTMLCKGEPDRRGCFAFYIDPGIDKNAKEMVEMIMRDVKDSVVTNIIKYGQPWGITK